jgi:hypothetical protein
MKMNVVRLLCTAAVRCPVALRFTLFSASVLAFGRLRSLRVDSR